MGEIKIPVCEPSIGETELQYVTDCVRSGWISSKGEYMTKFEEAFSKYCGAKFGVSTSIGTAALHLALLAIGTGPSDEVIIPAFTMIATANAVTSTTGARPVLVDLEPFTWNANVQGIKEKVSGKTKAVMVVHTYCHPVDMDPVLEVAQKHGLYVVEDACEAQGAEYKGKRAGTLSDIGCFSFYANKIITTGEGGMLVTNNEEFAERARLLRDQAFEKTKRFWHKRIGYNYRMTNLQAAVGLAPMERIDEFVKIRRGNAAYYNSLLGGIEGITLPAEAEWAKNVY
ncbi:MAG: DegT/DnrJ/EryC1/StrS family aminotransferase [Nitrososphaerales archaeon]